MSNPYAFKRVWPIYVTILVSGFAGSLSGYLKASLGLDIVTGSMIYTLIFLPAILASLGAIWLQERLQHK